MTRRYVAVMSVLAVICYGVGFVFAWRAMETRNEPVLLLIVGVGVVALWAAIRELQRRSR